MKARETPVVDLPDAPAPSYEAFAQLVKMLLPSSGCVAVYGADGELNWCSDGYERPDLRGLVDQFKGEAAATVANEAAVRQTRTGLAALIARLGDAADHALGFILVELGQTRGGGAHSMAASLLRPLFKALGTQLALEGTPVAPASSPVHSTIDPRLEFLLGIGEIDFSRHDAIDRLLNRSLEALDCISAVFCVPDHDLTIIADREPELDDANRHFLEQTRRHLLAWAQLNNRPMVVNRVETKSDKAPYKILSCPVRDESSRTSGLLALFRAAEARNFELNDIRLVEFMAQQSMRVLSEQHDVLSGLISAKAFERRLDELIGEQQDAPSGTVLYLDVDGLAAINESFGFAVGDEVIRRTAQLLRRSIEAGSLPCRIASDRFAIFLPTHSETEAKAFGRTLVNAACGLSYTSASKAVPVALRFGIAPSGDWACARHWIAAAERACASAQTSDAVRGDSDHYNDGTKT